MGKYYYSIYDMEESEICLGIFDNLNEVAEYLGVKRQSVDTAIYQYGGRVFRRYRVEKILKENKNG